MLVIDNSAGRATGTFTTETARCAGTVQYREVHRSPSRPWDVTFPHAGAADGGDTGTSYHNTVLATRSVNGNCYCLRWYVWSLARPLTLRVPAFRETHSYCFHSSAVC